MIIWSPTPGASSRDGIWVPEHRFGSFGGRGLAFFGAVWGAFGTEVIATGWTGGVERWKRDDDGEWTTAPGVTGHFGAVQSVAWDPKGNYILSTGSDQTSRIHARCQGVWAEIARPQIHGYDMVDAAFLSPFRFCSAAEEKVMRVFDATEGFAASLRSLGVCEVDVDEVGCGVVDLTPGHTPQRRHCATTGAVQSSAWQASRGPRNEGRIAFFRREALGVGSVHYRPDGRGAQLVNTLA